MRGRRSSLKSRSSLSSRSPTKCGTSRRRADRTRAVATDGLSEEEAAQGKEDFLRRGRTRGMPRRSRRPRGRDHDRATTLPGRRIAHQSRRRPSPALARGRSLPSLGRHRRRPPRTRCPSPRRAAPTRTTRRCRSAAGSTIRRRPWLLILCRASAASLRVVKAARRSTRA